MIRSCFGELCEPLQYLIKLSFKESIFPDELKVANVPPVFKACGNTMLLQNTWARYVQWLIQILDSNIIYKKRFGFQEVHATDHAILQLVDEIRNNFEENNFTLA